MSKKPKIEVDPIQQELSEIKRLIVLQLLWEGMPQKAIAQALGVSEATMSRMFPKGMSNSLKSARQAER